MSFLTKTTVLGLGGSDKKARKRAERRADAEWYRQQAIGPTPLGGEVDAGLVTSAVTETPEERKRRLRRMATIMDQGGEYGELTLSRPGLLSR